MITFAMNLNKYIYMASQDNEYTYDQNGNMTKDLNRKISSIQYNLLNLPQNMTYSNNKSTTYVYDATGRKLQVEYVNPATTFDYCGNVIYVNDRLSKYTFLLSTKPRRRLNS